MLSFAFVLSFSTDIKYLHTTMADSDGDGFGPGPPSLCKFDDPLDTGQPSEEITPGGRSGSRQRPAVPPITQDFRPEAVDALIARVTSRHRWDCLPQQVLGPLQHLLGHRSCLRTASSFEETALCSIAFTSTRGCASPNSLKTTESRSFQSSCQQS